MRFLVVEDFPDTLASLKELLRIQFPGVEIDTAASVSEGHERLRSAVPKQRPYDVVILDIKLPAAPGENPEVDESLFDEVRAEMPAALIAHITGHTQDQGVRDYLRRCELKDPRFPVTMVSKKDSLWPRHLVSKISAFTITRQMDDLFGILSPGVATSSGAARAGDGGRYSATHPLAELMNAIIQHWDDLDNSVKERIRVAFEVEESHRPVIIRLRLPEPSRN